MALLVISRNAGGDTSSAGKYPGVRLVETLSAAGVFSLLDVPSRLHVRSFGESTGMLRRYIGAAITLIRHRNKEVFFYNLPLAYLPLYLVSLLTRFRLPSLLLADGHNCFGMESRALFFLRLFRRVISLPLNDVICRRAEGSEDVLWFPGCAVGPTPRRREARMAGEKVTLVFNSSLLSHNSPETALKLARETPWMEIVVTDSESKFRQYLDSVLLASAAALPANLRFAGPLPVADYLQLMADVDGVLLCRDERVFANAYNFPSKLIEALQLGVPLISQHPITSVSPDLYCLIKLGRESIAEVSEYIDRFHQGAFLDAERKFLALCRVDRLKSWVIGQSLPNVVRGHGVQE